jgi:hypothetical protein
MKIPLLWKLAFDLWVITTPLKIELFKNSQRIRQLTSMILSSKNKQKVSISKVKRNTGTYIQIDIHVHYQVLVYRVVFLPP